MEPALIYRRVANFFNTSVCLLCLFCLPALRVAFSIKLFRIGVTVVGHSDGVFETESRISLNFLFCLAKIDILSTMSK